MKKVVSIILVIVLIAGMTVSVSADSLEDITSAVKLRAGVTDEYTNFDVDTGESNGKTHYSFSWRNKEDKKYIYVYYENGAIVQYDKYENYEDDNTGGKKLPQLSDDEAVAKLKEIAERLNPNIVGKFDFANAQVTASYDGACFVTANYIVNGVPVSGYEVRGSIGDHSESCSIAMPEGISYDSVDGVIGVDGFRSAYKSNKMAKLQYILPHESKEAIPVYAQAGYGMYIDAKTGERFNYSPIERVGFAEDNKKSDTTAMANGALTQEEIEEIANIESLMTTQEAVSFIKGMSEIETLKNQDNLSSNITSYNGKYTLYIGNYVDDIYLSASFDAVSRKLISISSHDWKNDKKTPIYNTESALKTAEAFIQKYWKDSAAKYVLNTENEQNVDGSANFYYTRMENGIPCNFDSISISVDLSDLKVISASKGETEDITFATIDGTIGEDVAYDTIFSNTEPKLLYIVDNKTNTSKLVYENAWDFGYINAKDGAVLNYSGKVKGEEPELPEAYTDLDGHYVKDAAEALLKVGIGFFSPEFKPDEIVTKQEFITLVSQSVWDYIIVNSDGTTSYSDMLKFAKDRGVLGSGEDENGEEPILKEQAVSYLLKAMDYERTAKIPGIFKTDFADEAQITPDLLGYVAIAKGLGIISGYQGNFFPQGTLTRAEAITIICNYISL